MGKGGRGEESGVEREGGAERRTSEPVKEERKIDVRLGRVRGGGWIVETARWPVWLQMKRRRNVGCGDSEKRWEMVLQSVPYNTGEGREDSRRRREKDNNSRDKICCAEQERRR
eukprot:scaffold31563_cov27-Tisochrysis_lutea.AAC.1